MSLRFLMLFMCKDQTESPTSFSLSFRTRSTISTSDLSLVHPSGSCRGKHIFQTFPVWSRCLQWNRVTHSITDDLQMKTLQFIRHLFVSMPIPSIKVWRPEELPVDRNGEILNQPQFNLYYCLLNVTEVKIWLTYKENLIIFCWWWKIEVTKD